MSFHFDPDAAALTAAEYGALPVDQFDRPFQYRAYIRADETKDGNRSTVTFEWVSNVSAAEASRRGMEWARANGWANVTNYCNDFLSVYGAHVVNFKREGL